MPPSSVRLEGVVKRFSHALACDGATFEARSGEVHALVGENGAGKSTLMRILYGMITPDEGRVVLHGEECRFSNPRAAIESGVGMVHQHFMLVGPLTAIENIFLGREPRRMGWFDGPRARRAVTELSDRHGLSVPLDVPVESLGVGDRQRIEILKALSQGARVLVLDEPTAVLTAREAGRLFGVLDRLRADGHTVIFITHRLPEVVEIADRVTVMRHGRTTESMTVGDVTVDALAARMVAGVPPAPASPPSAASDRVRLELVDVSTRKRAGRTPLVDIGLRVHAGEVVGVAGVEGNGQTDLQEVAAGLIPPATGRVLIDGVDHAGSGRRRFLGGGVSFVPEDRLDRAVIGSFTVAENLALGRHRGPPFARGARLSRSAMVRSAEAAVASHDIRPPSPSSHVSALSGGNQQKLVMARELSGSPVVIVAAQPTRGVDVGAIADVHARLVAACERGAGVLLLSAELEELTRLSNRIVVLYRGCIVGKVATREADVDQIGRWMTGGRDG